MRSHVGGAACRGTVGATKRLLQPIVQMPPRRVLFSAAALVALHVWTIALGPRVRRLGLDYENDPRLVNDPRLCGHPPLSHSGLSERCLDKPDAPTPQNDCGILRGAFMEALIADVQQGGGVVMLVHGSLLGWYRECSLTLKNDHDIDVGLSVRDWNLLDMHHVQWRAIGLLASRMRLWLALRLWVWGINPTEGRGLDYVEARGKKMPAKIYFGFSNGNSPLDGCDDSHVDIFVQHSNGSHIREFRPDWQRAHVFTRHPLQKVLVWGNLEMYAPTPCGESLAERVGPGWAKAIGQASHTHEAWMKYFAYESTLKTVGGIDMGKEDVLNMCTEVGSRTNRMAFVAERLSTGAFVLVLVLRALCSLSLRASEQRW